MKPNDILDIGDMADKKSVLITVFNSSGVAFVIHCSHEKTPLVQANPERV